MRVAPSSQTVWHSQTSESPSSVVPPSWWPTRRSAAASTSGGSALATLLRSRCSVSKSVSTFPLSSSTPQCASIRKRRMPSSSWRGIGRSWLAMYQPGTVGRRERVVGAGEGDLVELPVAQRLGAVAARRRNRRHGGLPVALRPGHDHHDGQHGRHRHDADRARHRQRPAPARFGVGLGALASPEQREQLGHSEEDQVHAARDRRHLQRQGRREHDADAQRERRGAAQRAARDGLRPVAARAAPGAAPGPPRRPGRAPPRRRRSPRPAARAAGPSRPSREGRRRAGRAPRRAPPRWSPRRCRSSRRARATAGSAASPRAASRRRRCPRPRAAQPRAGPGPAPPRGRTPPGPAPAAATRAGAACRLPPASGPRTRRRSSVNSSGSTSSGISRPSLGDTDLTANPTTVAASPRFTSVSLRSRTKKTLFASSAARRKICRKGCVWTTASTTDSSSGRAATRSVEPRSTRLTTISRETRWRTPSSSSAATARSANASRSMTSSRA